VGNTTKPLLTGEGAEENAHPPPTALVLLKGLFEEPFLPKSQTDNS
jgi:hypothetical protein